MAYLKRPQAGEKALQSIYDSVISILDYLPTLTVRGDNSSTYVEHSAGGTVVHAKQSTSPDQTGQGGKYYAGSGIAITSGNFINAKLSAGPNINIDYNSGWLVISGTPAGSGSSSGQPPSNGRFNTIGAGNSVNSTLSGCGIVAANLGLHIVDPPPNYYITINETPSAGYNLISCDLTHLTQLYNYDLVSDSQAAIGSANMDHYVRAGDLFINSTTGNRGLGTQINFYKHSIGNTYIDPQTGEQHLVNPIMGLKVDLTVSGGTWMGVSAVPRQVAGFDVDPEELEINCLLTGTYDHYPHTSGFIDIVPTIMEDGKTWGVISTNLHAGSGIAIDAKTGEITCTIEGGGGTTVIFKAPDFAKLQVTNDAGEQALGLGNTYLVPVSNGSTVRYEADGGTIIARWAPVEGSSENAFDVTTTNQYTPDDGYVRISVIDSGTLDYGCVRLYVNNKALPLHKFAKFNYSSGAIYEGGRYTTIQTTSTRINAETELEEEYTLENPIINNMLTGGRFITIQEEENNVELEYPRINCDLSEGTNIQITTGGVINCTLTGLDQLTNTPGYITSPGPAPTAYYADDDTLSTTNDGTNFYVRNVSSLLTGAGGTTVYYYGTGLNNTIVAGISSLNYQGGNGIQILPVEGQGGVATTNASIGLSTDFYNALTTILARPATGNYVLGSLDGELTWLSTCVCDEVSNG